MTNYNSIKQVENQSNNQNNAISTPQSKINKIIICATQRCGSTLVCNDFRNNGIGKPEEYFLGLINSDRISHPQQILDNIQRSGLNKSNVFSVKLMSSYSQKINDFLVDLGYGKNEHSFWSGIADYFSDATWVYIQRESVVRQAVSRFMSRKTGINHAVSSSSDQFVPGNSMIGYDSSYNNNVQYNAGDINADIVNIARENFQWSRFFQENNITPVKISYEDIVDDINYISQVREAANLACQNPASKRTLVKLANEKSEKIIQLFIQENTMSSNS